MTNYVRVIPRDLFNEAKLLKCLGALYIAAENNADVRDSLQIMEAPRVKTDGWEIRQDKSDGSIQLCNVHIVLGRYSLEHFTPLNSRAAYPLYVFTEGGEHVRALDEDGKLSAEFLELAERCK